MWQALRTFTSVAQSFLVSDTLINKMNFRDTLENLKFDGNTLLVENQKFLNIYFSCHCKTS